MSQAVALPASVANLTQPRKYISVAETAKLIRAALKEAFPEVKFSVRSSSYSGGASIRVGWVDGPKSSQVEAVAKTFQGASFDGMQDLKSSNTHALNGQPVRFGADYVFCNRELSDAAVANMEKVLEGMSGDDIEGALWNLQIRYHSRNDSLQSLARVMLHNFPQPAFEGRASKLADSINNITAE